MKYGYAIAAAIILTFAAGAFAQTQPSDDGDIAPGFRLRPTGGIDIGDMTGSRPV